MSRSLSARAGRAELAPRWPRQKATSWRRRADLDVERAVMMFFFERRLRKRKNGAASMLDVR